jgi:signal transduction histidine kinase
MKIEIAKIAIDNEMDIVLAHRRAMQILRFSGINISEQTRFATAVSEICRNALEFCKAGEITFNIVATQDRFNKIQALVTDCGPGIKDLQQILSRNVQELRGKGRGIVFSKKLVDEFRITSNSKGTTVDLAMHIPPNNIPINSIIVQGWISHIKSEPAISAYEELKIRNASLMQLTDELKAEQLRSQTQIAEIKELNAKLVATNSYLEEFTYTVSHDLKTPLTTLNLTLNFLEGTTDPESQIAYMKIIGRAAKRLERTIQGLVEILDLQTKQESMVKQIRLHELMDDVKEEFQAQVSTASLSFTEDFMVDEVVYIVPYLTSIFTNIIGNSIKYRVSGRPVEISVSSRRKGGMVLIEFKDNSEGIDLSKNAARMFTPFTRFTNSQDGKGIGLYLIKKMIERNGGRIEVQSEKGVGTTFSVYLREYKMPAATFL